MARVLEIAELGAPVIRERAVQITNFQDSDLPALIGDLFVTAVETNAVGIAAPQVYAAKRIIILSPRPNARYPYAPDHGTDRHDQS